MKTRPIDLDLERLRRLPPGTDVWQLAVRPTPQWVVPDDDEIEPYRPLLALCRSLDTGLVGIGELALPGEPHPGLALQAVSALARQGEIDARPAVIEMTDPALSAALRPALEPLGIDARLTERVESVDEVFAHMRQAIGEDDVDTPFYDPAIPVVSLRAFAEAALAFEAAAPWNHLGNEDLVHVETRRAPSGMRWFSVMGAAGMRRGIAFVDSEREFVTLMNDPQGPERMAEIPHWSITFDRPHMLPLVEFERWEEQALPRAGDGSIPVVCQLSLHGLGEPVDAARLDFAEGLLRVLAETTEDELDAGRWSRTVRTAGGERAITLALPDLLAAEAAAAKGRKLRPERGELPDRRLLEREMAKIGLLVAGREWESVDEINAFLKANAGGPLPDPTPEGSREQAQELFYAALEAQGRRRIKLAREALRLWPECADALVLLAEEMPDPARSMALYRSAMEAAERALGPAAFVEHRGHFWGIHETRPYMRARHGLAERLWEAGEHDAAVAHWREMLELNPGDNQGVRHAIIPRLLEVGRDAEAAELLAAHGDEDTAVMRYCAALAAFRLHGKGAEADRSLARAIRVNPHAVKYLLVPEDVPFELPDSFRLGSDEEAILVAAGLGEAWSATPGAIAWLRETRRQAKKAREQKRKKNRRRP